MKIVTTWILWTTLGTQGATLCVPLPGEHATVEECRQAARDTAARADQWEPETTTTNFWCVPKKEKPP